MRSKKEPISLPSITDIEQEQRRIRHRETYRKALGGTIRALTFVAAIAVLISSLLLPVLQVTGTSMEPTLKSGEIIIVIKTNNFATGDLCCFSWNNKTLIKRVIATAGDWVDIKEDGTVYVNDVELDEPYISEKSMGETDLTYPYQVPENTFFVMGDKRDSSVDSRSSIIGCVYKDQIIGKVQFRIWPFERIGFLKQQWSTSE